MGHSSLMWNRVVLYVTEKSHVGQNSLILDREVSYGTEESRAILESLKNLKKYLEARQTS